MTTLSMHPASAPPQRAGSVKQAVEFAAPPDDGRHLTPSTSLQRRVAGSEEVSLKRIVAAFYDAVMGDETLAPFFDGADLDHMKSHQERLMALAFSGEDMYTIAGGMTGPELRRKHMRLLGSKDRPLRLEHWERFVTLFEASVAQFDIPEEKRRHAIASMRSTREWFLPPGTSLSVTGASTPSVPSSSSSSSSQSSSAVSGADPVGSRDTLPPLEAVSPPGPAVPDLRALPQRSSFRRQSEERRSLDLKPRFEATAEEGHKTQPSLQARVTGSDEVHINRIVEDFLQLVLSDPQLSPFFETADLEDIKRRQAALIEQAFGGEVVDAEEALSLRQQHADLIGDRENPLTEEHWKLLVAHFESVVQHVDVPQAQRAAAVDAMRDPRMHFLPVETDESLSNP